MSMLLHAGRRYVLGSAPEPTPPDPGQQVKTYTEDTTTDFINPERGWMIRESHTSANFTNARSGDSDNPGGYSVIWSDPFGTPWTGSSGNPFRLDNFKTSNLPASLLNNLDTVFAAARTAGVKMKVRFQYNYSDGGGDTTLAWMKTHITQLAPKLNANKDVIAAMDAGFYGDYGEWSGSSSLVPGGGNWWDAPWLSAKTELMNHLLDSIDSDIMIMMRYPRQDNGIRMVYPSYQMPLSQRFSGSKQSRVGWYNDCFLINQSNGGTYDFDAGETRGNLDRTTAAWVGQYAVTSAETCSMAGLTNYSLGAASVTEMEFVGGPDHLFRKFWTDIYDRWISSGHYATISRRLGYRLVLNSASLPLALTAGSTGSVTFTIKNVGFGKVYNKRPLNLVLKPTSGAVTRILLSSDARTSLPLAGETKTVTFNFTVPGGMTTGNYSAYLELPDAAPGLASDVRYSIRLANTSMWDGATGFHNLNASISVTGSGGGGGTTLLGVGSISTSLVDYPKSANVTTGNYYVDGTNGNDSNSGTSLGAAKKTISAAVTAASSGNTIIVRGGTYAMTSALQVTKSLNIRNYGTERWIIDRSTGGTSGVNHVGIRITAPNVHITGFGIKNAPTRSDASYASYALEISGVNNAKIEDGVAWGGGTAAFMVMNSNDSVIMDCVSIGASGAGDGTDRPDGFVSTADRNAGKRSNRTVFVRCLAANSGDDCYDFFVTKDGKVIDCVAISAGYGPTGATLGDGNGFKMGGWNDPSGLGNPAGNNTCQGSVAVRCKAQGLNHNTTQLANYFYNNTSWANAYGIINDTPVGYASSNIARNNIAVNSTVYNTSVAGTQQNNTWNLSILNAGFASTSIGDLSLGTGSSCIGAGVGGVNLGASTVALELLKKWWNHSLIWMPSRGAGPGGTGLPGDTAPPSPPSTQTQNYTVDTSTIINNPERGWFKATELANVNYDYVRNTHNMSLIMDTGRLDAFRTSDISAEWLNSHNAAFQNLRNAGIKIVLRYSYNFGGDDATLSRILGHIDQLAPIWQANADVIASMQGGFIGRWGEWNGSTNGNGTPSAMAAVTSAILSALPNTRMVAIRAPYHYVRALGSDYSLGSWTTGNPPSSVTNGFNAVTLNAADRFNGSNLARTGAHNDSFLVNYTDGGTYAFPEYGFNNNDAHRTYLKQKVAEESRYTPYGGEIAEDVYNSWSAGNRLAGADAIAEMEMLHLDYLNRDYGTPQINGWVSSGHYNTISRRMGYNIGLQSATLPNAAGRGSSLSATFTMVNNGFGKIYNPRPLDLVLVASGGAATTIRLSEDIRRVAPLGGTTATFTLSGNVPSGMSTGTYSAYLRLPDAAASLQNDTRYCIQLANTGGLWNSSNGRHNLNMQIQVT